MGSKALPLPGRRVSPCAAAARNVGSERARALERLRRRDALRVQRCDEGGEEGLARARDRSSGSGRSSAYGRFGARACGRSGHRGVRALVAGGRVAGCG